MKKDELNNLDITNSEGHFQVEENSLNNLKEINTTPEIEKSDEEVFKAQEENEVNEENLKQSFEASETSGSESSSASSSVGSSTASAAGAIGGVVGVVAVAAVSAVLVLGVVQLPVIPAVDVHLISASSSSLSFELSTNITNLENLYISLKGAGYEMSTPFQEYVKFQDLKQSSVYTLSVYQNEQSHYSSNFYTNEKEEINDVTITVTSYEDNHLLFYFEDARPGDKIYDVNVKDKAGKSIFTNQTRTPREYEIDNFIDDVAIFVSVNGVLSAGTQVFKPVYDYEHIEWIWGEYGETVTAIIPSKNGTSDYYVRDIRNFEIERKEATCLEDGYSIRQAAFIGPDKNRYEDTKEFVLESNGHDFSDLTYTWSEDYHSCHAQGTCAECGTAIEETVICTVEQIETETGVSYTKYTAPFENENFRVRYHYEDLYYGSYPQSQETDSTLVEELNYTYGRPLSQGGDWMSYNYYANSEVNDYMFYIDVDNDNDGTYDYRGVYFTDYRPINTTEDIGSSSYQYDNGYLTNTTYWFKYEPIKWDVLTYLPGYFMITTDLAIDSQSYYHELSEEKITHNGGSGYTNNYELSDIRNWLNDEFYNLAFPANKDSVTNVTSVDNSIDSTLDNSNPYVSNSTSDRMFLLSRYETKEYLLTQETTIEATDYAKCQGLYVASNSKAFWGLRTPYLGNPYEVRYITNNGNISYDNNTKTSIGIRPACWINV